MRVAVVVMVVSVGGGAGHFFYRHYAAVGFRAAYVLKLDGGVTDVVVVLEDVVQVEQDAGALRGGDVGDGDVAG